MALCLVPPLHLITMTGIINRDNRIYTLKLDKDKEELERFVAQWRSVLTVSQHPDGTDRYYNIKLTSNILA